MYAKRFLFLVFGGQAFKVDHCSSAKSKAVSGSGRNIFSCEVFVRSLTLSYRTNNNLIK